MVHLPSPQELEFFDRSTLSDSRLQQLGEMVAAPYFLPVAARGVSRACESLCRWSRAVHRGVLARRQAAPLEARRDGLLQRANQTRRSLGRDRKREEEGGRRLAELDGQLTAVHSDLEEEKARLAAAEEREGRAAVTVAMAAGRLADWTAEAQVTGEV